MRLQSLTEAWFPVENDPDKTEFKIKHLRAGESTKIAEATHSQRFEFRKDENGEVVPTPILEIGKIKEKELTVLASVTGWKNVFDAKGKKLEYSSENMGRFCQELSEKDFAAFLMFVEEKRKVLVDQIEEQEKATRKN